MRDTLCSLSVFLFAIVFPVAAQEEFGITGVVLSGPEQPLAGARVELVLVPSFYDSGRLRIETGEGPEPSTVAASDEGGRFRLSVPGAGSWKVVVKAQDRVPVQFGPMLWVEPGMALPPVAPPVDVGTAVTVTGADGKPVQGAWVVATDVEELTETRRLGQWRIEPRIVHTGPDGVAVLPRIGGRPLDLRILPPGGPMEIHRRVTGGTVRLSEQGASGIVLRARTPAGEPLAGVQVRLGDANWPVGMTDEQGALPILFSGAQPIRMRLLTAAGRHKAVRLPPPSEALLAVVLDEPRILTGRVLDAATGRGLPGALLSPEEDPGALVRADEGGRYRLAQPGPGDFHLQIRAPEYLPKRLSLSASDMRTGRIPSVSLERATPVAGIVLDAQRRPLAGAEIEAVPAAFLEPRQLAPAQPVAERTESDASGRFVLRRLQATENYEIRAHHAGYLPAALALAVPKAGMSNRPLQIQLGPARSVQGQVLDSQGQPLAEAVVSLRPAARLGRQAPDPRAEPPLKEPDLGRALSNPQGRFHLPAAPAEELDIQVTRSGFAPAWRRGVRATGGKGPVDLGKIILSPGARLAGRVVDAQARPVAGTEIFLLSAPPRGLDVEDSLAGRQPETVADARGRFVIADLPSGVPYHLVARAEDHLPGVLPAVQPSEKPLVVRLERAASLRGRVVDPEGTPVAGAQVGLTWREILPENPELQIGKPILRQEVTDAEGRFEMRGSPEGLVLLDVTARGFAFLGGVEVRLPLSEPDREVELVLSRGASLHGRITTTVGDPVVKARVSTEGSAGWSDAEGLYRVEGVDEGSQEIRVDHPDYARLKRVVVIEPGENNLDFVVQAGTEVSGRVVDEIGGPVSAAEVVLMSMDRRERRQYRAVSAEDGRFSLQPVMAGEYRLEAEANENRSGELQTPVRVTKEPLADLEVVLRQGVVLSGNILGLTPDEIAAVRIEARKAEGKSLPARLDAEGRYEIRGLKPGDWLVRAVLWQGRRQAQARVPVAPDDRSLTRDLEFGRRASLSGRVLFNDDPLPEALLSLRGQRLTQERSVSTDYEGAFLLDDLEPDTYQLGINHPGKLLVHNQWVVVEGAREVEIRLEDAKLAGRVQEAGSGQAIHGAIVSLRPTKGPEFLFAAGSREDGSFHLIRVPPAHYRLTVNANGYETLEQEVQVVAGEDREGLDLSLSRAQGARLQVRRASGNVPEMIHLLAQAQDGRRVVAETRKPDAEGWIDLATLPAGAWGLRIGGTGASVVTLSLTTPGEPLQVTLPDAATFQVRVADLAAEDMAATVTLTSARGEPFWTLAPGGQIQQSWAVVGGRATVEGIPPGVWALQVQASDGRIWSGMAMSSGQGAQDVAVGSSEAPEESLALRAQSSEAPPPAVIPSSFM